MSPEQSAATALTPASDWYSVGTILYEALTGTLPFVGSVEQVLRDKRSFEPLPPRARVAGLPPDLDRLATELLRLAPELRPSGAEILACLGARAPLELTSRAADPSAPIVGAAGAFVGRARHLEQLGHALEASAGGRTLLMIVSGPSGMGKTMLVRKFLDGVEKSGRALVLAGRCYERESVPFKALDPIVDALCHRLMLMDAETLARVLPEDAAAVARIFPVLYRVEAIAGAPDRKAAQDPVELLRRAVRALREILSSLAKLRPVVLFIDDLQWGDTDSAALLAALLEPPSPPPLLLLTSHRSEDDDAHIVQKLRALEVEVRSLALSALSEDESHALALELLEEPAGGGTAEENARSIAMESGGNPFFISELARYARSNPRPKRKGMSFGAITLDEVLDGRFDRLAPVARRLLEVLAVAGRPIKQAVANRAAGLAPEDREPIDALRHQHLVRTRGSRADDLVETFHDRIRERAHSLLDREELAETHRALALALEALDPDDAEGLAMHCEGAGRIAEAAVFAVEAAEQAFSTLAFDRAAELFRSALRLDPHGPDVHHRYARLGDSLANAGRGADAADAYLEGAKGSDAAVELERLAAEQLLRSGHVDEGLAVLDQVTRAVGLTVPKSPERALASLLFRRARIALRGTSFVERKMSDVDPALLARIDVCWSGALGLGMIDVIRSLDFHAAHFLSALDAGEPYRVSRAFAGEAITMATAGGRSWERARRLIAKAEEIATRIDHPHALGFSALTAGMIDNLAGRWATARRHYQRAERWFVERCAGATWEIATTQHMSLWALAYLGGMRELAREVPLRLREAIRRGDLYAATHLATGLPNLAWVVRDDVDGARAVLAEGMGRWSRRGFHLQHYNDLLAQVHLDLYQGRGEKAVRLLASRWGELERSMLLRVQQIRIEATHAHARARLLVGDVAFVERAARRIERERMAWASPLAALLLAGRDDLLGKTESAISLYARAARELDDADMRLYASAARKRQGELTGGSEGQALVDGSVKQMMGEGIRDPARFAAMLVPHRSASR
jgi:tetratricopeptide (TPR) repeat protein